MALVFQYGSNTSTRRINSPERLRGDARSLGPARTVATFELAFTVWSTGNNCAAADLIPGNGRQIWGVLYDIPDYLISRDTAHNRKSLDAIEGSKYQRQEIQVCGRHNLEIPVTALTYTVIDKHNNLKTSREYVMHIIAGLTEHQVQAEYIDYVRNRAILNNPDLQGRI